MAEVRQIPLDLPIAERRGRDDWIVSEANADATALIERFPDWPGDVVLVTGPVGAGKSHLAHVFAERSGAAILAAADLSARDPVELARNPALVVEDLGEGLDETALFHLLNAVRQAGGRVLLTAATAPSEWGLRLADLASRLRAATPVTLREPDDALLEALLAKLFSDRQTMVDPSVIAFLARRMERSFAAAHDLVAALDREALAAKTPITRTVAARVVAALGERARQEPQLDDPEGA
jgi:chromosomal replication initiation ATPase DnaA